MSFKSKDLLAFNRGVVSPRGLARIDIDRMAMSGETQTNWMPRVLGSMMLRVGLEFIATTVANADSRIHSFIFEADDTALLVFRNGSMSVIIDDAYVDIPSGITAAVTNGTFTSNITSWTDASDTGGSVQWLTDGGADGYAGLQGDGTDFGILQQTVTVNEASSDHWLVVLIEDGPVRFKVGSTAGDDDYVSETRLNRGTYKFKFTPSGNFTIEIANEREFDVRVGEINIQSAENQMTLTATYAWTTANLSKMRLSQSNDVVYVACDNHPLFQIERRGDGESWGIAYYLPEDGPFKVQNVTGTTITPSALIGDITLTASQPLFKQTHADNRSIWRIASAGQTVTASISAQATFTDPIRVVGKETARTFSFIIENRVDSTITLQFGFTDAGPWNDISPQYTADTSSSYTDGQDDQIIYYRLGIKTGDYGTDTVTCTLTYTGGSIQGIARVIDYTSSTVVTAQVLKDFGAITASKDWWEGEWSDRRKWPTSVDLHEGRLWFAGQNKIFGSLSDLYHSFDDNVEGDSGTVSRSIGFGPNRIIHWLLSMGRLLFGTSDNSANIAAVKMDGNKPLGARSDAFDTPLTPFNFNIKAISSRGVFVDRTEQRLYELAYSIDQQDYDSIDLSVFAPDFNSIGIIKIAVQMKPDVRIHCIRSDGTAGVLIYDRLENVICWIDITSPSATGLIEDVAVLPGTVEDQVYYIILRTINSINSRQIVKWALESEAVGGNVNKIADSFAVYSGADTTTPFTTELLHLRGETVVIWADGKDVGTDTVTAAGALTNALATAAGDVVAGLTYTAQFKSSKLGEITGIGLLNQKIVRRIGFVGENMHHDGLQFGPNFTDLYDLPQVFDGDVVAADTIHSTYHQEDFAFGGEWDTDSRICLQAVAPRPCTLLAAITEMESVEKPKR